MLGWAPKAFARDEDRERAAAAAAPKFVNREAYLLEAESGSRAEPGPGPKFVTR